MKKQLPIILLGIALVAVIVLSYHKDPSKILAWPEGVTALAVLFTLFFIAWQALLMRQSVFASDEVSKRELRAYLTVVIGTACFQQRRDEDKGGDLKFESDPLLVNTGRTPARNMTFKARAAIMQIPLPQGINLPDAPDEGTGAVSSALN
jgi:hypothetical protein